MTPTALVTSARKLHEWGKFSAYGVPNCLPGADTDSDGDCDEDDVDNIHDWRINIPAHYDVRGDVDLDSDVDASDETLAAALPGTLGWGRLSGSAIRNRQGMAGYDYAPVRGVVHVRNRMYKPDLGRWAQRDRLGYVDGVNLHCYVQSRPVSITDPEGLQGPGIGNMGYGKGGGNGLGGAKKPEDQPCYERWAECVQDNYQPLPMGGGFLLGPALIDSPHCKVFFGFGVLVPVPEGADDPNPPGVNEPEPLFLAFKIKIG